MLYQECIVQFREQYPVLVLGVVPSLMGDVFVCMCVCVRALRVCVCMYVVDSPKRHEEAMNTGRQSPKSPSSVRQVSWFILRGHRDTGPTA